MGKLDELSRIIDEKKIDEVIVLNTSIGRKTLFAMMEICDEKKVQFYTALPAFDVVFGEQEIYEFAGVTALCLNEDRAMQGFMMIKQACDILLSAALLVLLAPLFLMIAGIIKIDSKGPIFFHQIRIGKNKKPFVMYKFRTMVPDAEERLKEHLNIGKLSRPVFKIHKDPRVTRSGRFMRKFSLDELPQLFNILKGDMSFVGPRPEEGKIVQRYNEWERRRLKIKPGLTGLQQVFCRGTTNLDERIFYDILYMRRRSLFLDIYILAKTFGAASKGQ